MAKTRYEDRGSIPRQIMNAVGDMEVYFITLPAYQLDRASVEAVANAFYDRAVVRGRSRAECEQIWHRIVAHLPETPRYPHPPALR